MLIQQLRTRVEQVAPILTEVTDCYLHLESHFRVKDRQQYVSRQYSRLGPSFCEAGKAQKSPPSPAFAN
jgi:hypothetical protein